MQEQEILRQINNLTTESRNELSNNIDKVSTLEKLQLINNEDKKVAFAVEQELVNIAKAVDIITEQLRLGGRLIYIGAGTSGRLGLIDAVECPPTFSVDYNTVVGLIAGGEKAFIKAQEGAEDSLTLAQVDLQQINLTAKDVVCGIAASGRTPYVIGGLDFANSIGCQTIAIACNKQSIIGTHAKHKIEVELGAEVISGSTRMKAGTAQKLILNMISSTVMINLGKVYHNLMVDVKTSNEKLVVRAKKIITQATGVDFETASNYLNLANNSVKIAIVMISHQCNYNQAVEKLSQANDIISKI